MGQTVIFCAFRIVLISFNAAPFFLATELKITGVVKLPLVLLALRNIALNSFRFKFLYSLSKGGGRFG